MPYFEKRPDGSYTPTPQTQRVPPPPLQNMSTRPPVQNYEAHYQNQHSLRYDPSPSQQKKKKSSKAKFFAGTAFLLACALSGFGGSAAAIALLSPSGDASVVYQALDTGAGVDELSTNTQTIAGVAQTSGSSVVSVSTQSLLTTIFNQTQQVNGVGSGVVISEDGLVLTNNHVVEGAQNITVTLGDGREVKAVVVGTDSATDVALLRIEADGLTPAVLANSDEVQVGDFCLAIGNPTGELQGTVTDGIISALDREITIQGTPMTLLQMSAPVSPGNSGGGLFNSNGELVGLVNAKSSGEQLEGLGFAIPINTAMSVAEELLEHGYVAGRPFLGVSLVTVSEENAAISGLGQPGLYINEITAGSGADEAGLQSGDRIATFDGEVITDLADLTYVLAKYSPGDTVTLEIERGGQLSKVEVTLGEQQVPTA